MANDLSEIHERIEFCRTEISTLAEETNTAIHDVINERMQPRVGLASYDLYVKQTKPFPVALRSRAGTIANELRACLDGLACQLAIRNGNNTKQVYFPISASKTIFDDDGMRKISKLSDADKAAIIKIKPFREANPLLFGLHEADRTRKHQRLICCACEFANFGMGNLIQAGRKGSIKIGKLEIEGRIVAREFAYDNRSVELSKIGTEFLIAQNVPNLLPVNLRFELQYSEPDDLKGKNVLDTLREFADIVESIVNIFG